MRRSVGIGVVGGLIALAAGGCAMALAPRSAPDAVTMSCPARLASDQRAAAPAGWTTERSARDGPLAGIAFYDGPLADQVELAPSAERREGAWLVSDWTFDGSSAGVRMACRYGGTDVVLTRALPTAVKQCSLRMRKGAVLIDPDAVRCR